MEKLLEFKPFKALMKQIGECMDFKGRTACREYWFAVLGLFIIDVAVYAVTFILCLIMPKFIDGILLLIYRIITLAATFLYVSMSIRRLHDVNKSPLFLLLWLTGIGGIVPIIFCAQPSHPEANEFGPVPTSVV